MGARGGADADGRHSGKHRSDRKKMPVLDARLRLRFVPPGLAYGVPTNVVTLCAVSVTVAREFDTVTGESWARLLAADVS